ncbi:acylphosphatase [Lyngbya aestuarii]|uniref:acylphosphatase n=1 Tax=Lyngbya aestuarii TaxID=118322 RepID=UPI00403DFABC
MPNSSTPQEQIRTHVFLSGKVQGVGFRYSTGHQAKRLRLGGWVKNLSDGRVEAVFEGAAEDVQAIVRWCHQGPTNAAVESVQVEYEKLKGLDGFEIR